jgi:putative membrane protein insertion efficiency factor
MFRQTLGATHKLLVIFFIGLINFYRYGLNPFFGIGNCCRFYPSCSKYSETALLRFGAWKGIKLTVLRLLRCHPFHPGGVDLVPPPVTKIDKNED